MQNKKDILMMNKSRFESHILDRARKDYPDLPADAEAVAKMPNELDPRFWVDIVSEKHSKDTDDSAYDEPPSGDPVFAQYILVPNEILQEQCPEFFSKYGYE